MAQFSNPVISGTAKPPLRRARLLMRGAGPLLFGVSHRRKRCLLSARANVHFQACMCQCPLLTQSGHYAVEHSWLWARGL